MSSHGASSSKKSLGDIVESAVKNHWLKVVLFFAFLLIWKFNLEKGALSVLVLVALGNIAFKLWMHYIRTDFISGIDWVVLEVVPPRDVLRSPKAMELFITNALYHFSNKGGLEVYWQGAVWFWFSLEIASIEGQVHFFIRVPTRIKRLVETQMYAQFPQAQIKVVEDYTLAVDKISDDSAWDLWGCEFKLAKPDVFPIKTYVDFGLDKDPKEELKVDPITPIIELFGSLEKDEQMWLQIVITPSKKVFKRGGKEMDWIKAGELDLLEFMKDFVRVNDSKDPNHPFATEIRSPQYMDAPVKAASNKMLKVGFDTGIRACYVAKKNVFNANKRRDIRLIFRQYAAPYINEIVRFNGTQADAFTTNFFNSFFLASKKAVTRLKNRMLQEYQEREFFHPPLRHSISFPWPISPYIFPNYFHTQTSVLNTEEIASLWHFPGQMLRVPTLERIESKEASPPTNLPM